MSRFHKLFRHSDHFIDFGATILKSATLPGAMRQIAVTAVLLVATCVPGFAQRASAAQGSGVRADTDVAATGAVEKLEIELCGLLVRGEWQMYAANLTDDYVRVLPGKIQSKAEVLEEFRTSTEKTVAMTPEKMQTRIYGKTAVVIIDLLTRDRTPDGTITENRGRATKVFVRRNGRWYLAQLSGAPLQ
jgi:ketosteroid isomerase-like protein